VGRYSQYQQPQLEEIYDIDLAVYRAQLAAFHSRKFMVIK
jgi:hypothetical protein